MGKTLDEAQAWEKETRKKIMVDFLAKHNLEEKDVKDITDKTEYGISVVKLDDKGTEKFILLKRVAESDTFRITVDYDTTLEEGIRPEVNRKQKRKKKGKK